MSDDYVGADGVIETFDPNDSIGRLRLDDGREVRFGASACKGFLPVVGARVRVEEVRQVARGGVKARRVSLLDTEKDHHERAAKTYGLKRPVLEDLRGSAALMGWATVMLDAPLPDTQAELDAVARHIALDQLGLRFVRDAVTGDLTIEGGSRSVQAYPVPAPIGDQRIDLALAPPNLPRGAGHVSLSLGLVDMARKIRQMNPALGQHDLACLGQVVSALTQLGPGVVLDLAEGLTLSSEQFRHMLAGEDPLKPWTTFSTGHDDLFVRSRGMQFLHAPDVAMATLSIGAEGTAALLGVVAGDLANGWRPQPGETLGFTLADEDLNLEVVELGSGWWLQGSGPDDAFLAHHAGMWLAAADRFRMRRKSYVTSTNQHAPAHYIDVFTGLGGAMITNGVSLAVQPGGTAEHRNERVELMCYVDRDSPAQARLLSVFAGMMFSQAGDRPFRAWDGLKNGPDTGLPDELAQMILVPREPLVVWPGHAPEIFQVVAVSFEEYEQLKAQPDAGARWLEARNKAADWKTYHQRFNALAR